MTQVADARVQAHSRRCCTQFFLIMTLLASSAPAVGEFGVRIGTGSGRGVNYQLQELYYRTPLPWTAGDRESWHAVSQLEMRAGRFATGDDDLITVGTGLNLWAINPQVPVQIGLGTGPTYFSQTTLGNRDIGDHWQFTSHASIFARLSANTALGYRVQHTASQGLLDPDGGLTVQSVEVRVGI